MSACWWDDPAGTIETLGPATQIFLPASIPKKRTSSALSWDNQYVSRYIAIAAMVGYTVAWWQGKWGEKREVVEEGDSLV